MKKENYVPRKAKILQVKEESKDVKTFRLKMSDGKSFNFMPGQFVQVTIIGVGECPISMCSNPQEKNFFDISVRNVGNVTSALFRLKKGDTVGIRGPYGNGFPVEKIKGKDIILVAGGVGFPPLNSVVEYLTKNRKQYGKITMLYGVRSPENLIFRDKIKEWKKKGVEIHMTVDKPDDKWKGDVGVVTVLFDKYYVKGDVGLSCGPPIMMKFVTEKFQKIGIKPCDIHISLERMMQCGMGKCGHCNIGNMYVCEDGPVFSLERLKGVTEMIW